MSIRSLLRLALVFALFGATARGQIDLPDKPVDVKSSPPSAPLPEVSRGNLADRVTGKTAEAKKNELDLPAASGAQTNGAKGDARKSSAKPAITPPATNRAPAIAMPSDAPVGAAGYVLAELKKVREVDNRLVDQAAQSLVRLGDEGRIAARFALSSDHAPTVIAAAKVLLTSGDAHDGDLVVARIRGKLPPNAGAALVDALVALDPVLASPKLLCEFLGHVQGAVRGAAYKHLAEHPNPELLPLLRVAMDGEQSDGRLRAVELCGAIPGTIATELLIDRLHDRSSQVADRAALLVAVRDDATIDAELLGHAFRERWILRDGAYALIAIVEREDVSLRPILTGDHVEALLAGIDSTDPFVSGACAAALAGIGFRADADAATPWLDQAVPLRLLRVVAGQEFSNDFSSLLGPATRRLALISGVTFGSNGPAWVAWWTKNSKSFSAARATLPVKPDDLGKLQLDVSSTADRAEAFTLLGSDAARAAEAASPSAPNAPDSPVAPLSIGDRFILSVPQVQELFDLCQREGVLGASRLPGSRGNTDVGARSIEIGFGARTKGFRFGKSASEPWFEKLYAAARSLRERNAWQRYRDPKTTAFDGWNAEHAWWDAEHTELERHQRLATTIVKWLALVPRDERDRGVAELRELFAQPLVARSEDFAGLLALLSEENAMSERTKSLISIVEASARALHGADAPLDATLALDLARAIGKNIGVAGASEMARVLALSGRESVRRAASAEEPMIRAVAATELARQPSPEDVAALQKLLIDPVEPVQIAAVNALADNKVEAARSELLLRARTSDPKLRAAALAAIGRMGGDGAYDALLLALQEDDPNIELAAARGFSALGDPRTSRLFVDLLAKGRESPLFEPAREGLLKLGEPAVPDLLRASRIPGDAGREAVLLLAREGVPESVPLLISLITPDAKNPFIDTNDAPVASELAILTCVDFRAGANPAKAWWDWWDTVVHDDPTAWLRGAMERLGVSAPPADAFKAGGSRAELDFLLVVAARSEAFLAERARRELSKLAGKDLGALPAQGPDRDAWIASLREKLASRLH